MNGPLSCATATGLPGLPAPAPRAAADALDVAGALDLFPPERRRKPSDARVFVYERVAEYPTSWSLVLLAGSGTLLIDGAIVALCAYLR